MRNVYFQKMAQLLVDYCLEVQPGDIVRVRSGTIALPLVHEVYRAAIRAGANILPHLRDETLEEILLREGSVDQLQFMSPAFLQETEMIDKWLDILSDVNPRQFTSIASERLALHQHA